jgi:uncharacterized protein (DUF1697 family)
MTSYVALLRAVNVGGTGKLPMADLRAMCERIGFTHVRTYIASGNVVFRSNEPATAVKAALERALQAYAGKPLGVHIRTGREMTDVWKSNPFGTVASNRTVAIFLDACVPANALADMTGRRNEAVVLGTREIYVYYADHMADSKLKIPIAKQGTARNMNTIAKLADWARE